MIKQLSLAVVAVALIIVGVFAVIDSLNEEAPVAAPVAAEPVTDARFKEK